MKTTTFLGTAFLAAAAGLALVPAPAQAQHMSMPMRSAIATQSLHRTGSSQTSLRETFNPDANTALKIATSPNAQAAVRQGLPQEYASHFNQCVAPNAPARMRGQVRVNFQSGNVTAAQAQKAIDCMKSPSAGEQLGAIAAMGALLAPFALFVGGSIYQNVREEREMAKYRY